MPKPRKTLDAALGRVGEPADLPSPADAVTGKANASPAATFVPASPKRNRRVPKLSVYLSEATHRQLREIAHAEYPTKLNDLLLEGIDRVFRDRGRPSIAELDKETG